MGGFSIGLGFGLNRQCSIRIGKINPPTYMSCFNNGIWEEEGYWFNKDTWRFSPKITPFLSVGVWNKEGYYRFKDKFSFGMSFLPTGYFRYRDVYRFNDKFKFKNK